MVFTYKYTYKVSSFIAIRHYATNSAVYENSSVVKLASRRLNKFVSRGNKETLEVQRRKRVFQRSVVQKQVSMVNGVDSPTLLNIFKLFFLSVTPFVTLKTHRLRRGKRVLYKIRPLDFVRGSRKTFSALANVLNTTSSVSNTFASRLERELEALAISQNALLSGSKQIKQGAIATNSSNQSNSLRDKRDLIHQQAFQAMPYR